jgi:hypothetical protein
MDYMIKTISCSLIDLISGGDNCTCYGYNQKKLPNSKIMQKVVFPSEANRIFDNFLRLESWCCDLVCKKPQSLELWSIECSFSGGHKQGTPLMSCGGGLFIRQYVITASNFDGII